MTRPQQGKQILRKHHLLRVLAIAAGLGLASPLLGAKVEAKKDAVEVYDSASKSSRVLQKLNKGESLEAKERKGMYWQVSLEGGQTGFISVMAVTHKVAEDSNIATALREAVQKGRNEGDVANMRSRSAVMGVRGLDESSETAFAGNVKPNLRMVYAMENFLVKKDKIKQLGRLVEKEINQRELATAKE